MTLNVVVIEAIEKLNYRVTPGDVAAQAGLDINIAERDLVAIAADASAHLQVNETGDIAYQFSKDFRAILRNKFLRLRVQRWWQQIWRVLFYLIRISFGLLLLISILLLAVIVVALVVIVVKGLQQDDDGDRPSPQFPSGGRALTPLQGWQLAHLISLCVDLFSNYSYERPIHRAPSHTTKTQSSRVQSSVGPNRNLNFLEAVFSFLFGDGNPNANLDHTRWQTIGAVIRNYKGAIVAEQMAPYLDDVPEGWAKEDEDYILPILTRFNGRPAVSPEGHLIYYFPDLQVTASEQSYQSHQSHQSHQQIPPYLKEQRWSFSQASSEQQTGAIALGIVNIVLAILVGQYAFSEPFFSELQSMGLGGILGLYPILLVYGIGFLIIPILRYIWLQRRNHKLDQRNAQRRKQAEDFEMKDSILQTKLNYAQQFAHQTVVDQRNLIYSTESDLMAQDIDRNLE